MQLSLNHNKSESKRNRNYLMVNMMNKSSGDLLRTMQLVILIFISTVSTLLIRFSLEKNKNNKKHLKKYEMKNFIWISIENEASAIISIIWMLYKRATDIWARAWRNWFWWFYGTPLQNDGNKNLCIITLNR